MANCKFAEIKQDVKKTHTKQKISNISSVGTNVQVETVDS